MLSVELSENLQLNNVKEHYLIYKITNIVNGKYYVGKHITSDIYDNYSGSGTLIKKAISKYGISAFVKTILFDLSSISDMNKMEEQCVQLSNCFPFDQMSYNLKPGGLGGSLSGELNPLYKGHLTDEHKEKISLALKDRKLSEAHKANLSKAKIQANYSSWDRMSDVEKQEVSRKLSYALKGRKHNKQWNEKISKTLREKTEEEKQEIYKKFLTTLSSHTAEEKLQIYNNRSKASKGRKFADTTNMSKASKAMWNDPIKKQQMLTKRAEKYAAKTDEEIKEINKKKGSGKNKIILSSALKLLKKYNVDISMLKLETFPIDQYKSFSKDQKTARLFILENWLKTMNINIELITTLIWVTNGKINIKVAKNSIPTGFHIGLTQLKKVL